MTWSLSTTSPLSIIVLKIGRDRGHVLDVVRDSPSLPKSRGAVVVVQPPPGSKVEAARAVASNPSCLLHLQLPPMDLDQHMLLRNSNAIELSTLLSKLAHSIQVSTSLNRSVPTGNGHGSPGVDCTQQDQRMLTKEGEQEKAHLNQR